MSGGGRIEPPEADVPPARDRDAEDRLPARQADVERTPAAEGVVTGEICEPVPDVGPTVEEALRVVGFSTLLDAPVSAVLAGLGLRLPAITPVPAVDVAMPMLNLESIIKPLTDLLGVFGTGRLSGGSDPTSLFGTMTTLLTAGIGIGTKALGALDGTWSGAAARSNATATAGLASSSGALVGKAGEVRAHTVTAAASVATGYAALQGVVAKFVGVLVASVPVLLTPPGQAIVLTAAAGALAEGLTIVAATKASLVGPTAAVTAAARPVAVPDLASLAPAAAALVGGIAVPLAGLVATGIAGAAGGVVTGRDGGGVVGSTAADRARTEVCAPRDGVGAGPSLAGAVAAVGAAGVAGAAAPERPVSISRQMPAPVPREGRDHVFRTQEGVAATPGCVPMGAVPPTGARATAGVVAGTSPTYLVAESGLGASTDVVAPAVFGGDRRPPSGREPDVTLSL